MIFPKPPKIIRIVLGCWVRMRAFQAALGILSSERADKMLQLRCMEHGCQLLVKDIREAMPWLQVATKDVNRAIKSVRRSKKFFGKLKASGEISSVVVFWLK